MFVFRDGFRVDVHAMRGGERIGMEGGGGRRGVKVREKPYPRVLFSLSATHRILAGCSLPRLRGEARQVVDGKEFSISRMYLGKRED